jgi:hypothetical protein
LVLVVFGVEAHEGCDGSDFWFGGLGLREGAREGEDRGEGETLHAVAPDESGMPKYSAAGESLICCGGKNDDSSAVKM